MTQETLKYQDSLTEAVCDFVSKARFEDLPEELVHERKRDLLDCIGNCFPGLLVDKGRLGVKLASKLGGPPEATIIGTTEKVSSACAALANGELMNALDFGSVTGVGHMTPYATPGPLALAERIKISGKKLLLAVAVGSEVGYRIAKALTRIRETVDERGERKYTWSEKDVYGYSSFTLGGALAAGKVLELDKEKLRHAVGIAAHLAPMPTRARWLKAMPMAMTKYGPAGWISQATVTSALLAEMDYTGDITVLDGEDGFATFSCSKRWSPEEIVDGLGATWRSRYISYKTKPVSFCQQPADELFAEIMEENNLRAEDIETVKILADPVAVAPALLSREIKTHVNTQFCTPYVIAVIAYRIPMVLWQNHVTMRDPKILKLMDKVTVTLNPNCGRDLAKAWHEFSIGELGQAYPEVVQVVAKGKVFRKERAFPKGRALPESLKLTDSELIDKFKSNASWVLTEGRINELVNAILCLEKVKDVSEVMRLTSM